MVICDQWSLMLPVQKDHDLHTARVVVNITEQYSIF